tara:strand:- start:79 stop:192 length:114 start_codon:yes stop_codon:yes gene_type:complete
MIGSIPRYGGRFALLPDEPALLIEIPVVLEFVVLETF